MNTDVLAIFRSGGDFQYRKIYECPICKRKVGACGMKSHLRAHERKGEITCSN